MTSRNTSTAPLPVLAIAIALAVVVLAGCAGSVVSGPSADPHGRPPPAQGAVASPPTPSSRPSALPAVIAPPAPAATLPTLTPVPSALPTTSPAPDWAVPAPSLDPPAGPGRFAIDLYRRGDFVPQATVEWCVPAAMLTMMNVIDDDRKRSRPGQRWLNRTARSLSSPRLVGPGSEPEGWARTLDRLGYGPYRVVARPTRAKALATAARALRFTGRPVGLLVWRGSHAWVMTGFEASADPAWTDDFRVTRVRISDPWYPRARAAWGRPPRPDTRMSAAGLAKVFLRWRRPAVRYAELDGRYVLVLPVPGS